MLELITVEITIVDELDNLIFQYVITDQFRVQALALIHSFLAQQKVPIFRCYLYDLNHDYYISSQLYRYNDDTESYFKV